MNRSLSFGGIFAALTVLSAGATSIGCSKSESARAVEERHAEPATTTPTTATPAAPMVAPTAATAEATTTGGAAVDAGTELTPTPAGSPLQRKAASATCGAQGCSPEMKKGK